MAQKPAPRKPNLAMAMLCLMVLLFSTAYFSKYRAPVCLVCMFLTAGISAVFGISYLVGLKRVESWDQRNVPITVKRGFALIQGLLLLINAVLWLVWAISAPCSQLELKRLFFSQYMGVILCLGLGAIPSFLEELLEEKL